MMQVSKKVPFDDPNVLDMVRGAYILSNVIIAGLYFYVQAQINKKKGKLANAICKLRTAGLTYPCRPHYP
jgi:hypothetical protein